MAKTLLPSARWKRLLAWGREGDRAARRVGREERRPGDDCPRGRSQEKSWQDRCKGRTSRRASWCLSPRRKNRFARFTSRWWRRCSSRFPPHWKTIAACTELAALREAAEADRRSLLTRLGRKEMAETIVGADSGLRHVMERVELVAQSDVPVLILGETGTGKEVVVAGHPHAFSRARPARSSASTAARFRPS